MTRREREREGERERGWRRLTALPPPSPLARTIAFPLSGRSPQVYLDPSIDVALVDSPAGCAAGGVDAAEGYAASQHFQAKLGAAAAQSAFAPASASVRGSAAGIVVSVVPRLPPVPGPGTQPASPSPAAANGTATGGADTLGRRLTPLVFGEIRYDALSGLHAARYTPFAAGVGSLATLARVDHRAFAHLPGSPRLAAVAPGRPSARLSRIWGRGAEPDGGGGVAGNPFALLVQPRDARGNSVLVRVGGAAGAGAGGGGGMGGPGGQAPPPDVIVVEDISSLPREARVAARAVLVSAGLPNTTRAGAEPDPADPSGLGGASVRARVVALLLPLDDDVAGDGNVNGSWSGSVVWVAGARFELRASPDLVPLAAATTAAAAPAPAAAAAGDTSAHVPGAHAPAGSIAALRSGLRLLCYAVVWTPSRAGVYSLSVAFEGGARARGAAGDEDEATDAEAGGAAGGASVASFSPVAASPFLVLVSSGPSAAAASPLSLLSASSPSPALAPALALPPAFSVPRVLSANDSAFRLELRGASRRV